MTNLLYLLVAVLLSAVGSAILWYRHRRPTSLEHSVESFTRELRALAPDRRDRGDPRHG